MEEGGVPAVTVQSVLDSVDLIKYRPLLVKIDIEGAEADLFSKNIEWVDAFPLLMIEPHDFLFVDQGTSASLQEAVLGKGKNLVINGENLLFF